MVWNYLCTLCRLIKPPYVKVFFCLNPGGGFIKGFSEIQNFLLKVFIQGFSENFRLRRA